VDEHRATGCEGSVDKVEELLREGQHGRMQRVDVALARWR
jgi:hypothetical protein